MRIFAAVAGQRAARSRSGSRLTSRALCALSGLCASAAVAAACDLRTLDVYVGQNPRDANAYVARARCLLEPQRSMGKPSYGNLHAAAVDLETAVRLDPRNVAAHYEYARAAALAGHNDLAKIHYTSAIDLDPLSARSHVGRGWAELNLCQVAEASADFDRALALDRTTQREVASPEGIAAQGKRCAAAAAAPAPVPNDGFRCGQNAMLWCRSQAINALAADKAAWIDSCAAQKIAQCN
jgi:tetratricopeptide (TPR) repeat protein